MDLDEVNPEIAPELQTSRWFNTTHPVTLSELHGRVVVLVAFQMLCPGCVAQTIPLAQRLDQTFDRNECAVVGL
ncbi:MAG: redoxin domain-containing protein, partial [Gammaproteobacteria bacterium]|nr:redoxin domain-containing protein [Gammaproteobacteria bacterium]